MKAQTPAKLRRDALRREKEIATWEREKARPKRDTYLVSLIFVLTLIYATDEIASQIGTLMKTEIANDLMSNFGDRSVGMLDLVGIVVVPFQIIGLAYRSLADKWGRKTFLLINTFGMSLALLVIFLSNNLFLYFLGACMIQFFIPHDMHVVYIMETAPAKHRARMYSAAADADDRCFPVAPGLSDPRHRGSGLQLHRPAHRPGDGRFYRCPASLSEDDR